MPPRRGSRGGGRGGGITKRPTTPHVKGGKSMAIQPIIPVHQFYDEMDNILKQSEMIPKTIDVSQRPISELDQFQLIINYMGKWPVVEMTRLYENYRTSYYRSIGGLKVFRDPNAKSSRGRGRGGGTSRGRGRGRGGKISTDQNCN